MHRSKRAQSEGGAVAVILIIIALFMVVYLLFVSPEERERILDSNNTDDFTSSGSSSYSRLELVAESPGLVTPTKEFATVHRMPSVNIFLSEEPVLKSLSPNLIVSKGLFSSNSPILKFNVDHLDETTTANVVFAVDKGEGTLRMNINGDLFYAEDLEKSGVQIVEIPKSKLAERNELQFSVSSPGLAFWSTNQYNLNEVNFKQEFLRRNKEETRSFTITSKEKLNLAKASLKYTQTCNKPLEEDTTNLDILVNERRAHSAVIRCVNTEQEIEIDPQLITDGQNTVTLRLEKGDFSFNELKVETESKESERPTYFFSLTDKQFEDIKNNRRRLQLQVLMDNNNRVKNSRILINSNEVLMQYDRNDYRLNLKDYVVEGTNFVKIVPINSFNIVGLKVVLE